MAAVSDTLTVETEREGNGSYRFTLLAEGAQVTARSTSTYQVQADAVTAGTRLAESGPQAEVVEADGGHALRISGANLEAVTQGYPDAEQARTILDALTG